MIEKFTKKGWLILIVFGMIGQIAWAVENMYFNLFLFETVSKSLSAVKLMVQLSGITATLVTLLAGTISDKLKNRRTFISLGYIIWGITVLLFAFITTGNVQKLFNIKEIQTAVSVTLGIIVAMDCIMTAFGSTANDACFNAWVTDNTQPSYRGRVESVLAVLPLIAMLIVAGGFGMIVEAFGGYTELFIGLGSIISITGILGLFLIKDSESLQTLNQSKFSDIFYGFKPSVIKENKKLYLNLCIIGIFGIATQVFMPYLIIFMKTYLDFSVLEYSLIFGAAIIIGAIIAVILGKLSDKWQKEKALYLFIGLFSFGLLVMYFTTGLEKPLLFVLFGIGGTVMILGNILVSTLTGAMVRDNTPEENVGKLQGVRMIFSVLIPMLIGPEIGDAINKIKNIPLPDLDSADTMTTKYIPAPEIFLVAALIALTSIAIIFVLNKVGGSKNDSSEN